MGKKNRFLPLRPRHGGAGRPPGGSARPASRPFRRAGRGAWGWRPRPPMAAKNGDAWCLAFFFVISCDINSVILQQYSDINIIVIYCNDIS